MFIKFKRLNNWLKRNFPRDKADKRRFRSVAEGLDQAEALDEFDADLETLSAQLHHATMLSQNRRVARHTSDISHRIGKFIFQLIWWSQHRVNYTTFVK